MLIQMHDSPWVSGLSEKDICRIHNEDYRVAVAEAKAEAAWWRNITRGKKHPEGLGVLRLTVPQIFVDAALHSPELKALYDEDREKFWCWAWHRYPDFRCTNTPKCPWCGKFTRTHND